MKGFLCPSTHHNRATKAPESARLKTRSLRIGARFLTDEELSILDDEAQALHERFRHEAALAPDDPHEPGDPDTQSVPRL